MTTPRRNLHSLFSSGTFSEPRLLKVRWSQVHDQVQSSPHGVNIEVVAALSMIGKCLHETRTRSVREPNFLAPYRPLRSQRKQESQTKMPISTKGLFSSLKDNFMITGHVTSLRRGTFAHCTASEFQRSSRGEFSSAINVVS